jgi:hypothetical protein
MSWGIDKGDVTHTHTHTHTHAGILFCLKREWNLVINHSMDEPIGHYIKPGTKRQMLHDFT